MSLRNGTEYSYIHYLQGSDLPIRTQDDIHRFFDAHKGTQYVNLDKHNTFGNFKCQYRHFFCHNRYYRSNRIVKILNFGLVAIQQKLGIRKNTDIHLYHGSALFSITGECARYILSREREIKQRFRWALAADEVFIQTILMDSPYGDKIANIDKDKSSNARLIDWTRPRKKNSPHVWHSEELDYIMNQPEDICFARKFDEKEDLNVAMLIKRHIGR